MARCTRRHEPDQIGSLKLGPTASSVLLPQLNFESIHMSYQSPRARSAEYQSRSDVYTRVTEQIVKAIEAGTEEWKMPWHASGASSGYPRNAATGNPYRGVNVLSLWATAHLQCYAEPVWATFKQWGDLGHAIRRGEKAATGVFWKQMGSAERDDSTDQQPDDSVDAESQRTRWIARAFPLFNIAQLDGYQPPELPPRPEYERMADVEAFVGALGADIRHGGNRAFYRAASDHIQMPPFEAFIDPISYYDTLLHETTHWTSHPSRLNRDLKGRFGSESYCAEELIAELGTAFIGADMGFSPEARPENAAYIGHWLKILKSDSRAIFAAASHAQRAADYLHGLQPTVDPQPTPVTDGLPQPPQFACA